MYRVLLKIDKVNLKIRQLVNLHIIIKKDHKFFTHCKNEMLKNGEAKLSNSSQFLIDANNPKFQIEIYLLNGQTKKKGGVVLINLKNYTMNASHRIVEQIKKTPLANSSISIDMVYMLSEYQKEGEDLINLHKIEEMMHKKHLKEITDQHERLIYHNGRLNEEIKKLKERNRDLNKQTRFLEKNLCNKEEQYSLQLEIMEKEKEKSFQDLQDERRKIAEMVDTINQIGDTSLMQEMKKVINNTSSA